MNTYIFNRDLCQAVRTKLTDLSEFQQYHQNDLNPTFTTNIMMIIDRVEKDHQSVTAFFKNGKKVKVYFNGKYEKYATNGILASKKSIDNNGNLQGGHYRINIENNKIYLERFIAICCDIYNKTIPLDLSQAWEVNVMDGSGSALTANILGIPVNYNPDNLEWTLKANNASHGQMILPMKVRTGHVYRFSANDTILKQIYQMQENKKLIEYCEKNLIMVK